jgi:hypothetical protein
MAPEEVIPFPIKGYKASNRSRVLYCALREHIWVSMQPGSGFMQSMLASRQPRQHHAPIVSDIIEGARVNPLTKTA